MSDHTKPYVIVVGIDYSDTSELALERALELAAERPRAELHVLNVLALNLPALSPDTTLGVWPVLPSVEEATKRLQGHVAKTVAHWHASGKTLPERVVPHLRVDAASFEIAQLAADLEADLVVVGTHGRRGVARLVLGSVAETTVRSAPCPVLVVRPKALPAPVPAIAPPCPRCVEARRASQGRDFWCEQHSEHHGQRHTYHQGDRASADTNMPLVGRS